MRLIRYKNMLIQTLIFCFGIVSTIAVPIQKDDNVDYSTYFLPEDLFNPTKYEITINVTESFSQNPPKTFSGNVIIHTEINKKTDYIVLHAADMIITPEDVQVFDFKQQNIMENFTLSNNEKQFLLINLNKIIDPTTVRIDINYVGNFQINMRGFYASEYKEGEKTEYALATHLEPTNARKLFPCFDEPKYKSVFHIKIIKPIEYEAISNMLPYPNSQPETGSSENQISFKPTPKMSTYLVAFIVSKFKYEYGVVNNGKYPNYRIFSRPDLISQTKTAAEHVIPITESLNKFTNINYMDDMHMKMDMAAIPDFSAGAMENWGLLTYRETSLLVDENLSTNRDVQRVVSVISHEIAHQWFGNYVTLSWWNNTWLNEGFARYFEYMTTANVKPDWEMDEQFVVEQHQNIFDVDSLKTTTPLNYPVFTPTQIKSHFGTISYSKGGSVIRMMEQFLGSTAFQQGLQKYLKSKELNNAVPKDLWPSLNTAVDEYDVNLPYSVKTIMEPWINNPGYPVVDVSIRDNNLVSFKQKRFFLNPEEYTSESNETWFIPITYTSSKEKKFDNTSPKLWLSSFKSSEVIELDISKDDWFIVNIKESGYYRVNYQKENWEKLSYAMFKNASNINRINRAQLVDDAMNLARAGQIEYDIAFNITDYLEVETDYYPWYSAFRTFRFLLQRYSETSDTGKELRTYIKRLMTKLLKEKSLNTDTKLMKHVDVLNLVNALEWSCNLDVEKCVSEAKKEFSSDKVDKNLKAIVDCTAVRHDNKNENWNKVWTSYLQTNVAAKKVAAINSLGCTKDEKKLKEYLDMSITSNDIRNQDASYVFTAVYTSGSSGVKAALNFLKDTNLETIHNKYGGLNALETAVLGLASRLTTKTEQDEFLKILDKKELENIKNAAAETVEQNLKWSKTHDDHILHILKEKNSATSILINNFILLLCLAFVTKYFSVCN